jgi:hypothetical protein
MAMPFLCPSFVWAPMCRCREEGAGRVGRHAKLKKEKPVLAAAYPEAPPTFAALPEPSSWPRFDIYIYYVLQADTQRLAAPID